MNIITPKDVPNVGIPIPADSHFHSQNPLMLGEKKSFPIPTHSDFFFRNKNWDKDFVEVIMLLNLIYE